MQKAANSDVLLKYTFVLQIASQGLLKFCLRNLLGFEQRQAIFKFLDLCSMLLAEVHSQSEVNELLKEANLALAILEKNMPITIQVSV